MKPRLAHALAIAAVLVFFCAPLFVGLGKTDLENDEAIYSFAVDEMVKSGDWLTPKRLPSETEPFLEKPPLKFWIVGIPMRLGLLPGSEFGLRVWDAVMATLAFLYVFAIGRRLAGPLCGLVAVFVLFMHSPLLFEHGLRTNNMESAVFLAYAGAMFHFIAWRSTAESARRHLFAIAGFFVLGFMTKYVAALFLPVILVLATVGSQGDRAKARSQWRSVALAIGLATMLIAPWFIYQYAKQGMALVNIMFGEHVFQRMAGVLESTHVQPRHFYLQELWRQLWSNGTALLCAAGAVLLVRDLIRRRSPNLALMMLWFVVPLLAISTGTSKLYHYLYPFLPPVALAAGYGVGTATQSLNRVVAIGAAVALLWFPIAWYPPMVSRMADVRRPLGELRECLSSVSRDLAPSPPPGVWVEASMLSTVYYYYLRGLGPWQQRGVASDATVAMHLFAPGLERPVLLSSQRLREFTEHLTRDRPGLLAKAAEKAVMEADALAASLDPRQVPFLNETLLLPGPFSVCK